MGSETSYNEAVFYLRPAVIVAVGILCRRC